MRLGRALISANWIDPGVVAGLERCVTTPWSTLLSHIYLFGPDIKEVRYLPRKAPASLAYYSKKNANPRVADICSLPGGHVELASF